MDTRLLATLIAKKHSLLEQLRDAGRRQGELIDQGDMGQLLKMLSSKQHVIAGLHEVERQLDPYRRQDPDRRVWATPADRDRCAAQASQCEASWPKWSARKNAARLGSSPIAIARPRCWKAHIKLPLRQRYLDSTGVEHRQLDLSTGS